MSSDNEEWCKIWKGIDLSVQYWDEEFNKIWPEFLKISKVYTLMDGFWSKYVMLELRKYRRVMFDGIEYWCKIWRKTTCAFENDTRKIFTRSLKNLKIMVLMGFFYPKKKMHELKIYRGVMCHNNEEWCKIRRGTDLSFQNWPEEFDESWPERSKASKICILMSFSWSK